MRALALIAVLWGQGLYAEEIGEALYEGRAPISVQMGEAVLPAVGISCAGCHGHDGAGGREAGSGPPLLGLRAQDILRAVRDGIGEDGRTLSPAMPRFVFDAPGDAANLAGYIEEIDALQRSGFGTREIVLVFGQGAAAERFAKAFFGRVAQIAPRGVFGRSLVRQEAGGVVILAATRPEGRATAPHLFPLYMLRGDEDVRRVRGGFASLNDQIAALAHTAERGVILDPEGREPDVPAGWSVVARPPGDVPVIALGSAAGQVDPDAGPVLIVADDLHHLGRIAGCFTVADPRPAPDRSGVPPLERYGRAAAEVLVEALARCERECTRAKLFEKLDGLSVQSPEWPHLDYAAWPLTGTDVVALRRVCLSDDRQAP